MIIFALLCFQATLEELTLFSGNGRLGMGSATFPRLSLRQKVHHLHRLNNAIPGSGQISYRPANVTKGFNYEIQFKK